MSNSPIWRLQTKPRVAVCVSTLRHGRFLGIDPLYMRVQRVQGSLRFASSSLPQSGSDIMFCDTFCSGVCWFCICCGGGGGFCKSLLNVIGDDKDNHGSSNKSQFPPQPPRLLPAAQAQRLVMRAAATLSKLLRAIAITRKVQKAKQHTIIPRQIRPAHVRTWPRDENLRGSVGGGSPEWLEHACCGSNVTHAEFVL